MNGLVESDVRAAAATAAKTAAHIAERRATSEKKFIWIRRNPLKSPESTKENQGKPRKTKEIKAWGHKAGAISNHDFFVANRTRPRACACFRPCTVCYGLYAMNTCTNTFSLLARGWRVTGIVSNSLGFLEYSIVVWCYNITFGG
jgi:hypothetical protein